MDYSWNRNSNFDYSYRSIVAFPPLWRGVGFQRPLLANTCFQFEKITFPTTGPLSEKKVEERLLEKNGAGGARQRTCGADQRP
jgi:hypothetical protein